MSDALRGLDHWLTTPPDNFDDELWEEYCDAYYQDARMVVLEAMTEEFPMTYVKDEATLRTELFSVVERHLSLEAIFDLAASLDDLIPSFSAWLAKRDDDIKWSDPRIP